MVKIKKKKKKFWYLSFSSLAISLWSTSLFLTTLAQPYLLANFEPHKSLSSYFERKNVFSTLFPNCGNYHWAGSSRGERHLFEVPIYLHQPYGGDTETVSWGWFFFLWNQAPNLKFERKSPMWILYFGSFANHLPLLKYTEGSVTKILEILCIKYTTPSSRPSFSRSGFQDLVGDTGRESWYQENQKHD